MTLEEKIENLQAASMEEARAREMQSSRITKKRWKNFITSIQRLHSDRQN